jgi:hypothetical protein
MTIFAAAFTCGVLLALAAHMLAGHFGIAFAPVWASPRASNTELVRSALGWWLIAGTGLAGSFVTGLLLQEAPGRAARRRRLRWIAGLALFALLTALPHIVTAAPAADLPNRLLVNLTAFALGMFAAFCGGWFSLAR